MRLHVFEGDCACHIRAPVHAHPAGRRDRRRSTAGVAWLQKGLSLRSTRAGHGAQQPLSQEKIDAHSSSDAGPISVRFRTSERQRSARGTRACDSLVRRRGTPNLQLWNARSSTSGWQKILNAVVSDKKTSERYQHRVRRPSGDTADPHGVDDVAWPAPASSTDALAAGSSKG